MNKTNVVVGLSGGVDSSVSALLLKANGYNVTGIFMKNWEEDDTSGYCAAEDDFKDAQQVCRRLQIPLETVNFSQNYWDNVFEYFLTEYQSGRTPNPDILCNKEIKFKVFLEHAKQRGADYLATGHYVQRGVLDDKHVLIQGYDNNKDQTYFLYTLQQHQLQSSLFPVGGLPKSIVRRIAKDNHLIVHDKKDSTGICFIGERRFKNFLAEYLPAQPGEMHTPEGKRIGHHDGLMYYTLGQRQGLQIGGQKGADQAPWYVVGKDLTQNILVVAQSNHPWRLSSELIASHLHWVNPMSGRFRAFAKCRYRQLSLPCTVECLPVSPGNEPTIRVIFDEPVQDVTPGQSVVLYDGTTCLGGGIIQSTNAEGGLNLSGTFKSKNTKDLNTINYKKDL